MKECAAYQPESGRTTLYASAFLLQSFYTGVERALTRMFKIIDTPLPKGDDWHAKLLRTASRERPGHHPAIISPATVEFLDEFRAFRHAARNLYGFQLKPRKVEKLVGGLENTWTRFRDEVEAFLSFLENA